MKTNHLNKEFQFQLDLSCALSMHKEYLLIQYTQDRQNNARPSSVNDKSMDLNQNAFTSMH